jgi:hypothetical protein
VTPVAPGFQAILLLRNPRNDSLKNIFPKKIPVQFFSAKKCQEYRRQKLRAMTREELPSQSQIRNQFLPAGVVVRSTRLFVVPSRDGQRRQKRSSRQSVSR